MWFNSMIEIIYPQEMNGDKKGGAMESNMSKPGMKKKREVPEPCQLIRVKVSAWIIYHHFFPLYT